MSKEQIVERFDSGTNKFDRRTIVTAHNSKAYQVDGLTFEFEPVKHFFKWKLRDKETGRRIERETNMVEYFRQQYNITIDEKEPLLWVQYGEDRIYLPTS